MRRILIKEFLQLYQRAVFEGISRAFRILVGLIPVFWVLWFGGSLIPFIENFVQEYSTEILNWLGIITMLLFVGSTIYSTLDVVNYFRIETGSEGLIPFLARVERSVKSRFSHIPGLAGLSTIDIQDAFVPLELIQADISKEIDTYTDFTEILKNYKRIILRGDPGAGKTTLLRYATFKTGTTEIPGLPPFPIFASLKNYHYRISFLRFLQSELQIHLGVSVRSAFLRDLLENSTAIVFLDGLDEIGTEAESVLDAIREINLLVQEFPNLKIVVSSRKLKDLELLDRFSIFELQPLSQETIRKFISKRLYRDGGDEVEALLDLIKTSASLSDLARSPLLLSLLIELHKHRDIPTNLAEVYRKSTDLLFYRWDQARRIDRGVEIPTSIKYKVLKQLAFWFQLNQVVATTPAEVHALVQKQIPESARISPSILVEEITLSHGILIRASNQSLSFAHKGFQDFFAALELLDRDELSPVILDRLTGEWWRDVALIFSGMDRENRLPRYLYGSVSRQESIKVDDLLLLSHSLIESKNPPTSILRTVFSLLEKKLDQDADFETLADVVKAMVRLDPRSSQRLLSTKIEYSSPGDLDLVLANGLVSLGELTDKNLDVLILFISSNTVSKRLHAVRGLGQFYGYESLIYTILEAFEDDDDAVVRLELLKSLNQIIDMPRLKTTERLWLRQSLQEAKRDPDSGVADVAVDILIRVEKYLQ